ncbi:MAG: prepilin-type N-terminal cleavage/methylation domain-containing protein [Candidatus Niyogibacteria bacterium]|nr:prepilin-type N-terminal cleavage/methylation domain-containing protein [Candidatus Niyogibacteria bacterium]
MFALERRGFSLLETIIAIAVLTLAMTAVFTLVSSGIRSISASADELTAYFLASEGLEYIRNIRDGNIISVPPHPAFDDAVFGPCITSSGCFVDSRAAGGAGVIASCDPALGCPPLRFNREGGFYNHDVVVTRTNEDSIFTRQITMTCISPTIPCEEYRVLATMTWRHSTAQYDIRSFALRADLFNTAF